MGFRTSRTQKIKVDDIKSSSDVTINLNLTITLDSDGLSIGADIPGKKKMQNFAIYDDDVDLIVPDIPMGETINFGKQV